MVLQEVTMSRTEIWNTHMQTMLQFLLQLIERPTIQYLSYWQSEIIIQIVYKLQCPDTVGWVTGRTSGL